MGRIIIYIILVIFVLNKTYSQQLTLEEKQIIISQLDSADIFIRYDALENISVYQITEAIPKLVNDIWLQKEPEMKYSFLECLNNLEYSNTNLLAHQFIDSVENFSYVLAPISPVELKMKVTGILIGLNDYSTVDYLFDAIEIDTAFEFIPYTLDILKNVAENLPAYADQAEAELLNILNMPLANPNAKKGKYYALKYLLELNGNDFLPDIEQLFTNVNSDFTTKITCMEILKKQKPSNLETIFKEAFLQDTNSVFKVTLADEILNLFGTPQSCYLIITESINTTNVWTQNVLNLRIKNFKPTEPDSLIQVTEIIDSLISYENQCFNFGWISDTLTHDTLSIRLSEIEGNIINQEWFDSWNNMTGYLQYVETEKSNNTINNYAYKFLRYYAEYLEERLRVLSGN